MSWMWWLLGLAGMLILIWLLPRGRRLIEWTWEHTDPITKWLQIVALIVAACWTYRVFFATQAPGLLQAVAVNSDIAFHYDQASARCSINELVNIENFGNSVVDVSYVHLKVWRIDPTKYLVGSNGFRVFDLAKAQQEAPLTDVKMTGSITGSYVPKAKFSHNYIWTVEGKLQQGTYVFGVVPEDSKGRPLTPLAERWIEPLCQ
jgi:hypothetical protein